MTQKFFWLLAVTAILPLIACTDRPAREPFPGTQGRTTDIRAAETEKAVLGGFDPLNNPLSGGVATEKAPAKKGQTLKGVVKLGPGIIQKPGMYLYIAVRKAGQGGPPLAVRREREPKFPYAFTLSEHDAMIRGTPFEGEVDMTARLDADGDPLTHQAGDASGHLSTKVGDQNIDLLIDEKVTE